MTDLNQARAHNRANEMTEIDSSTTHVAEDAAGNMVRISKPGVWNDHFHLVYDAWNRLVEVRAADDSTVVAQNEYDGRNFRTVKKTYAGGQLSETRHFYYNAGWQLLEERIGATSTADRQNVWGNRYVDDLILRDRDTDANGTLDERLYALQDPNWNVVALANTSGDVQERYTYTAYGTPTVLTSTFGSRANTSHAWDTLFTGRQYDLETGFYHYRNRYYGAEVGRFINRDPIVYESTDLNLYRYTLNNPLFNIDPDGLDCKSDEKAELRKALEDRDAEITDCGRDSMKRRKDISKAYTRDKRDCQNKHTNCKKSATRGWYSGMIGCVAAGPGYVACAEIVTLAWMTALAACAAELDSCMELADIHLKDALEDVVEDYSACRDKADKKYDDTVKNIKDKYKDCCD